MIEEQLKEDCDRMSEEQLLDRVRAICRESDLPDDGLVEWYYNSPGPKCFRRVCEGIRTHTAYVQPFWVDIFDGPSIIVRGGLQ